jgi:hypothetical protein
MNRYRILVLGFALLVVVVLPALVQAAPLALPPRPTPQPTATSVPQPAPAGGSIELRVQFPEAWPWDEVPWQELWTVVQWQDAPDHWRDVEGWRGGLDSVATGEGGSVVGQKVWWVGEPELGEGPFRWLVTQGEGGESLATSALFDLPSVGGGTVTVEAALEPPLSAPPLLPMAGGAPPGGLWLLLVGGLVVLGAALMVAACWRTGRSRRGRCR